MDEKILAEFEKCKARLVTLSVAHAQAQADTIAAKVAYDDATARESRLIEQLRDENEKYIELEKQAEKMRETQSE